METATLNPRVQQLRDEARAKQEESAQLLERLTAEQGEMTTEIGWTVAATAAHLASGTKFGTMQLKQLKRGKAPSVPHFVIDAMNLVTSRRNRATPVTDSVATLRANMETNLALLNDWTDAELDTAYKKPYYGAHTYEEGLRYTFIRHFDEHMGQVKRALKI
jgi:hypothetical protein